MGISRSNLGTRYAAASIEGTRQARELRQNVADQLHEVIVETELTGSTDYVARRLREVADAERSGDDVTRRAAYLELSAAAAAMCVQIEMESPAYAALRSAKVTR